MQFDVLLASAAELIENQPSALSALSNASAFLMDNIPDLNWAGFYLFDGKRLVVGPFQGHVACAEIEIGKGVCGEAARDLVTRTVDDVTTYSNHIACDGNSRSETVVPLVRDGIMVGVLDLDSPLHARFDPETVRFLERFADLVMKTVDFSGLPV
jgi:L-methionine (R)-S-oxide reductase